MSSNRLEMLGGIVEGPKRTYRIDVIIAYTEPAAADRSGRGSGVARRRVERAIITVVRRTLRPDPGEWNRRAEHRIGRL